MQKAALIYNPKAGRGRKLAPEELAEHARRVLLASGWTVAAVEPTRAAGHALELGARLGRDVDRLVVIGGDGTLREVAEGISTQVDRPTLGIVPRGNGNVLAREIGLPFEDELRAAEIAAGSWTLPIDAGRVNGQLFLAMLGVGFDALVTRWVDRIRRNRLVGWSYRLSPDLLYLTCGAAALFRFRPQRFDLQVEQVDWIANVASLIVSNTRTYAKGWAVTPDARISDGRLDVCAWKHACVPLAVWPLLNAKRGRKVGPKFGAYTQGEKFQLQSERPFHFQLDGDPMGPADRLEIELLPGAFEIAVSDS